MTTVPDVLSALANGFESALPADFQVAEGTLVATPEQDYLIVGWDEDDQIAAVAGSWRYVDMAVTSDEEEYDVLCLLTVWTGDDDTPATRKRMFGYLALLKAWLTANRDLGVAGVSLARIAGAFSFEQPITGAGSTATLRFSVHVIAFTS